MPVKRYTTFDLDDVRWLVSDDMPAPLKETLLPRVSSPGFVADGTLLKQGTYKSIWRYRLPIHQDERGYLVKRYQNRRLLDRLLSLFRPSKARREWEAACGVSQRGVPTPVPLAIGVRKRRGMVMESFVILEEMQDCQDLNRFFLVACAPGASAWKVSEKWNIIKALGALARKANEAGVHQSDFALNNFLLERDARGKARLYLSDFEKITLRRHLTFDQEITCLAKLNRVGREVSRADRMRFLKSYAGAEPRSPRLRALSRAIQEQTRTILLQDYARGRKTSVYTDALYDRISRGTLSGFIRKGYHVDDILAVVSRFDLLAGNLPLREIKEREEIAVELSCKDGRHRLNAVRYSIRRGSRSAGRIWSAICTLALAGFPVSLPPVFLENRAKHDEGGYIFYPHREGKIPLGEFCVPSRAKKEIEEVLELLVILLGRLHRFGAFADALTESPFSLVEKKGGKPSLCLSNPEAFIIKQEVTSDEKKKNLILLSALIKIRYPTLDYDLIRRYFSRSTRSEGRHEPLPVTTGGDPG